MEPVYMQPEREVAERLVFARDALAIEGDHLPGKIDEMDEDSGHEKRRAEEDIVPVDTEPPKSHHEGWEL